MQRVHNDNDLHGVSCGKAFPTQILQLTVVDRAYHGDLNVPRVVFGDRQMPGLASSSYAKIVGRNVFMERSWATRSIVFTYSNPAVEFSASVARAANG